jgi:two-component system, NarL family, response regulator
MTKARAARPAARARVLIADDHALMRNGVANLLNQEADLEVVAEAADGQRAVELFEEHRPDVALVDLRMPRLEGVEVVRQIRAAHPDARLIILTTYDTDEDIDRALKAGAQAYLLKDVSAEGLLACIRDGLRGRTHVAPAVAARLAERGARVQLTPRELAVLRELADGRANKEIAAGLGISEGTVKVHLAHLFDKLGVSSRTEAIAVAARRGLVRL